MSEAVSQLTHFYTRDMSRKALDHDVTWSDARARPLWSQWGLAEFFANHKRDGSDYVWMQPAPSRLRDLWLYDQVIAKKGWKPFSLKELVSIREWKDLSKAFLYRDESKLPRRPPPAPAETPRERPTPTAAAR